MWIYLEFNNKKIAQQFFSALAWQWPLEHQNQIQKDEYSWQKCVKINIGKIHVRTKRNWISMALRSKTAVRYVNLGSKWNLALVYLNGLRWIPSTAGKSQFQLKSHTAAMATVSGTLIWTHWGANLIILFPNLTYLHTITIQYIADWSFNPCKPNRDVKLDSQYPS